MAALGFVRRTVAAASSGKCRACGLSAEQVLRFWDRNVHENPVKCTEQWEALGHHFNYEPPTKVDGCMIKEVFGVPGSPRRHYDCHGDVARRFYVTEAEP